MRSQIQCLFPPRSSCWALRLRCQCRARRSLGAQVQSSQQFFGFPGGAGKGGLRRQGLHFNASSLDRSLAGWCHHHSAALRLLLTLGTCCSVVLMQRTVESVPAMSSTLPRDEEHTRTHTRRLMHTSMEVYTNLCSHVHSHKPSCLQIHARKEHA